MRYYQSTLDVSELNEVLANFLPQPLVAHCRASAFVKGVLIISTTNAAFAYQLKFMLPTLRDKLRHEAKLYSLASIKIKIDSKPVTKETKTPHTEEKPKKNKSLEDALASLEQTLSKKYHKK